MKMIEINGINYEVVRNDNDCLNGADLSEKITDYFDRFDYIFGDFAYGKVRLKGFFESKNKKTTEINDIAMLDDYIRDYCSFGAKTFLLKKNK